MGNRHIMVAIAAVLSVCDGSARQSRQPQSVVLDEKVQIPGAVLRPGAYIFSLEDRLADRAIVRITPETGGTHYLLLTVPNAQLLGATPDLLVYFHSSSGKNEALRGWMCQGCTAGLEFVYPKAEATKLIEKTSEPVLAVDPESDKLPPKLSADDMKVVSLWLLSPKALTATDSQKGVVASKYIPAQLTPDAQTALAQPASSPMPTAVQMASTKERRSHLPKTAGNSFSFVFCGLLLMLAAVVIRLSRLSRAS